jgi:hypothetical protein
VGFQLFPFFPSFSRFTVSQKLAAIFSAPPSGVLQTFTAFVQWLGIAKLLETITGAKNIRPWMAALLLLVPFKLFIAGRTFILPELIGAGAAFLAWPWLLNASSLVAALFVASLVAGGLAPYHFQGHAAPFSLVPFQPLLSSDWISGFVILLRKSFIYGATIWLLKKAGMRTLPATVGVCALLAAIEAMQMYLPGRTPEITDMLLAGIMALILELAEGHQKTKLERQPVSGGRL